MPEHAIDRELSHSQSMALIGQMVQMLQMGQMVPVGQNTSRTEGSSSHFAYWRARQSLWVSLIHLVHHMRALLCEEFSVSDL